MAQITWGVLLRFYESFGSTVSVIVSINRAFTITSVKEVNLLETELGEIKRCQDPENDYRESDYQFPLTFTPFQMKTVIVSLGPCAGRS